MKGSVVLSLSLDVLAIGVMLVPAAKLARLPRDQKRLTFLKRACFLLLLLAGFLIDQFVSHPG